MAMRDPERWGGDANPPPPGEPEAAEVESARLLANETRDRLRAEGLDDERIDRLADRFVADQPGRSREEFIAWAIRERDAGKEASHG